MKLIIEFFISSLAEFNFFFNFLELQASFFSDLTHLPSISNCSCDPIYAINSELITHLNPKQTQLISLRKTSSLIVSLLNFYEFLFHFS